MTPTEAAIVKAALDWFVAGSFDHANNLMEACKAHVATTPPTESLIDLFPAPSHLEDPNSSFIVFWDSYPRNPRTKTRGSRVMALKAWQKLKPNAEVRSMILASIASFAQTQQWRDGFIPMAVTFLNQRRWEDAPEIGLTHRVLAHYDASNRAALEALLDKTTINANQRDQWFSGAVLRGNTIVIPKRGAVDVKGWIERHYLADLIVERCAPLTVVAE